MDGLVRLNNRGYNLSNLDCWKWEEATGCLFLYFTGSLDAVMLHGEEADVMYRFLLHQSRDIVQYVALLDSISPRKEG